MTRRIGVMLDLVDDVVLSADAATAGEHRSLGHIPGSALLGAAASRLYATALREGTAYRLFHSGEVRFGDALPVDDAGRVGWPMPLCLHREKDGEEIVNLALQARDDRQWQQLRDGWVGLDGRPVQSPRRGYVLRTAIDEKTGTADSGRLFGYETLQAGSRFLATIELDTGVPAALEEQLVSALTARPLRLGRSRSTEHGRVRASRVPPPTRPSGSGVRGSSVTIWALSDLALTDRHGQATLAPEPRHFGLRGGQVDWDRSFLRSRRYAPWNASLRARAPERVVIARGSVITFRDTEPQGGSVLAGSLREAGLGVCAVNPILLSRTPLSGEEGVAVDAQWMREASTVAELTAEDMKFIGWLESRAAGDASQDEWATREAATLPSLYAAVRLFNNISLDRSAGPTSSQWNRVMEAARQSSDKPWSSFRQTLFGPVAAPGKAICADTGWRERYGQNDGDSVAGWFLTRVAEAEARAWSPMAIAKLAREAAETDKAERAKGGGR